MNFIVSSKITTITSNYVDTPIPGYITCTSLKDVQASMPRVIIILIGFVTFLPYKLYIRAVIEINLPFFVVGICQFVSFTVAVSGGIFSEPTTRKFVIVVRLYWHAS